MVKKEGGDEWDDGDNGYWMRKYIDKWPHTQQHTHTQ